MVSSNQYVEAATHPQVGRGWDNIGTGGGKTGMRCPSVKRAARQGPVLVGTIGSLAQLESWGGAGLLGYGDARQDTLGQRGTKASPGGSGVDKGQDHKRQIQSSSSSSSQAPQGRSEVPRQPLGGNHFLGINSQGLSLGASG